MLENIKYRIKWAKLIWSNPNNYTCWCERLLGTITVLFGIWSETNNYDWTPLAHKDTGMYWSGGIQGQSWDTLVVKGFNWTVYSDGNL